jgi:tetratricopeptide (TPR) repeat protein
LLAQLAPASVALAICLYQLTMPNVLFGIHGFSGNGYDDGVYLGAAVSFVHGVIPYRDFAFLQPPGVVLLFSPVALIARIAGTRDALAIARCITAAVTALNVLLITRILRARGSVAMVTGGLALACFPLAVAADHSLLLEPYLVFFSLLGVKLLFDGDSLVTSPRIVAAGVALGFAGAIKIWAIAVVIAALLVCAPRAKGVAVRLVLGVAAGFALPCIPFFIAAPSNFVHDVVVAQLSRGTSGLDGLSVLQRVIDISGVTGITAITPTTFLAVAIVAGFSVFVFLVYGLDYRKLGRFDILLLVIPALVLVEMFSSPEFYDHYAYFPAAFLALLLGAGAEHASALLERACRRLSAIRPRALRHALPALPAVLAIVAACFLVPEATSYARSYLADSADPSQAIDQAIPRGACAVSDEAILLVDANRYERSNPDCPDMVDPFGMWIAYDHGRPPPAPPPFPAAFVSKWKSAMNRASYVVLSIPESDYIPWTSELLTWFNEHFTLVSQQPRAYVYRRTTLTASGTTSADTADQLVAAGLAADSAGNQDLALRDFDAAAAKDPRNVYAHYDLGTIYQQRTATNEAAKEYREALLIDPKFADALYNMGVLETPIDPAGAIQYYIKDLGIQPTNASANFNLGVLLIDRGQTSRGYSYLETGIRLNPTLSADIPPGISVPSTATTTTG